jgi:hypothetical protein
MIQHPTHTQRDRRQTGLQLSLTQPGQLDPGSHLNRTRTGGL